MSTYPIEIIGVTHSSNFPSHPCPICCIETCEADNLYIPCQKPDVLQILSVSVNISLSSSKVICTPCGKKLVVEAIKHIKIMYTAADSCQSVHNAQFALPICIFTLIKDSCHNVEDICTAIEYVSIHQVDYRCVFVSTLILFCPKFKTCQCETCDKFKQTYPREPEDSLPCESEVSMDNKPTWQEGKNLYLGGKLCES